MKISLTMNQLSHNTCVWLLRHKECNCLRLWVIRPSSRKRAFLPNTQVLWKYRSILPQLWLLYYTLCSGTLIFQDLLFLQPLSGLSHSFLSPSQVSPGALLWGQYSTRVSQTFIQSACANFVIVFHPKYVLHDSVQPVIWAWERIITLFSSVFVLPLGYLVLELLPALSVCSPQLFLIFTGIAFAQVLNRPLPGLLWKSSTGWLPVSLFQLFFMLFLVVIYLLTTTKSKMIPTHQHQNKPTQQNLVTPTHTIFQRLLDASKRKFEFFSKSYCDPPLLLGLVFLPCALEPHQVSYHSPKTHHAFHPEICSVFLYLEFPS